MAGTTSYRVSSRLDIGGNAQQVLRQLGRTLTALDKKIAATQRQLTGLALHFSQLGVASHLTSRVVANSMGTIRGAVNAVSSATQASTRAANSQAAALGRVAQQAARATAAAHNMASAMRALSAVPPPPRLPPLPRGGHGGGGGGGGRGRGGGQGERWRIARHLSDPTPFEAWWAARTVGGGLLDILRQGGELQTEMVIGREQTGPENADWFRRLRERAEETARTVPGTTPAGNIRAGMELRTDILDREKVLEMLPKMQEMAQVLAILDQRQGGNRADKAAGYLARFLNLRGSMMSRTEQGKVDLGRYQQEAEGLLRNLIASRNLEPRELVNFMQQARSAGQNLSYDDLFGGFAASGIRAMGGHRFGTGLAAFTRQFQVGIMTEPQAKILKELGLIQPNARAAQVPRRVLEEMHKRGELDDEEYESLSRGNAQRFSRRHMLFGDLVSTPEAWRREVAKFLHGRMFRGKRIDMNDPRTLDTLAQVMGGTETSRGFLSWLFDFIGRLPDQQAVRDTQPGGGQRILSESFAGAWANMTGSFTTLIQALGNSQDVVKLLNETAKGFQDLAALVRENPGFMKAYVIDPLRTFVSDTRKIATDLHDSLRTIAAALEWFRGKVEWMAGKYRAIEGFLSDPVGSTLGTILPRGPAPEAPRFSPGGQQLPFSTQEPMPPSWGGPIQRQNFNPMPPRDTGGGVQEAAVYLDGQRVGHALVPILGRLANAPVQSAARSDGRRAPGFLESVSA